MKTSKIMPPTYMLITMIIMVAVNFLFPIATIVPSPWNLFGLIPIGLGIYVAVVAENAFRNAKTTVTPFMESSALITNGLYRISRNPMYLGFASVLVGISVLMRTLTPFLIVPVFIAAIQILFIKNEERMLSTKFGGPYLEYSKVTRRWL